MWRFRRTVRKIPKGLAALSRLPQPMEDAQKCASEAPPVKIFPYALPPLKSGLPFSLSRSSIVEADLGLNIMKISPLALSLKLKEGTQNFTP